MQTKYANIHPGLHDGNTQQDKDKVFGINITLMQEEDNNLRSV